MHGGGELRDAESHRVDRVLSFFSSRWNWDSPIPSPAGECALPLVLGGGTHSLAREGVGGPNSNEGTDAGTLGTYDSNTQW